MTEYPRQPGEGPSTPLPARAMTVTLPLGDGPPLVGLAVEIPRMEVIGRDGRHRGPDKLMDDLGFVSPAQGFAAAYDAGDRWAALLSRPDSLEVLLPDRTPFYAGTLALAGEDGERWVDAVLEQDALLVISGPQVKVDAAAGTVALDLADMRWILVPFSITG